MPCQRGLKEEFVKVDIKGVIKGVAVTHGNHSWARKLFTPLSRFSCPLCSNKKTMSVQSHSSKWVYKSRKQVVNTSQSKHHYPILSYLQATRSS